MSRTHAAPPAPVPRHARRTPQGASPDASRQRGDRQPAGVLARGRTARRRGGPAPCRGRASGSRSSAAAPRWFMAKAYAALREEAGHGETDAFQASEFPPAAPTTGSSRSPAPAPPPRSLDLLDRAPRRRPPRSPPTRPPPAAAAGRRRIALPFADEQSVVQTRFATSPRSPLLRAHLGEDIERPPREAPRSPPPARPAALEPTQFTFLGRGWTVGLAEEAALKCREAALAGPRRTRRWTTGTGRSRSPRRPGRRVAARRRARRPGRARHRRATGRRTVRSRGPPDATRWPT